jgi:hypothetical protein
MNIADLKKRIERLERQERISRRWATARNEVARRERQSSRRLADYRRRLQKFAEEVDGTGSPPTPAAN